MDDAPRKRLDPLALAVHGIAIAALVGIAVFLLYKVRSEPAPPPAKAAPDRRLQDAVSDIRKWIDGKREELQPQPARKVAKPVAQPTKGGGSGPLLPLEPNRTWKYTVTVDPPTWRDVVLTYRVPRENGKLVAYTNFTHAGGAMQFRLGALEAGDPAHANVRFPGFFLHSAYISFPLAPGQRVSWGWPWQPVRPGRLKQFEGVVKGWEQVKVPLGTFDAVRIDAVIKYVDNGNIGGTARETIWLAPKVQGVVKVVREGVAPDEGFKRIVAELAEFK